MFSSSGIVPDSLKKGTATYTPTVIANFSPEKSSEYWQFHFTTAAIVLGILLLFMVMLILVPRVKDCIPLLPSCLRVCKDDVISDNPDYTAVESSIWSSDHLSDTDSPGDTSYEFDRENVKILYHKLLGRGEFGNVYQGLLFPNTSESDEQESFGVGETSDPNNGAIKVAIKMLRENTKELDKQRFISEAKLMRSVDQIKN